MSDELDIPMPRMAPAEPGYRLSRRREPMDATTRRLAMIGGVIGAALLVIGGAYAISGHRRAGVPVVEADSRPLRTKPEDRGGMQVAGQDDAILSGDSEGKDAMAPPPEQPAPQGLQEQAAKEEAARKAALEAAAKPEPVTTGPALGAPATEPVSLKSTTPPQPPLPIAAMPEQKPAHAQPAKSQAAATLSVLGGRAQVQFAALGSEEAALSEWHRLAHRMPDLLGGRQPSVQKTEHAGKTFFRLRTGGFVDIAQATAFCEQVRAKGGGCSLASF